MAQHVLDLVMQLKTGEVTAGLDRVESQINRVVESLAQFSQSIGPATLVNPQSAVVIDEINDNLKTTERYTGLVTDRNIDAVVANLEYLEAATATGEALRAQGQEVQNLTAAEVRRARIGSRLEGYLNNVDALVVHQADLITDIMNDAVKWQQVTEDQFKDVKEMVKHFEAIDKAGKSIEDEFGISQKHFEKIKDFAKEGENHIGKTVDYSKELMAVLKDLGTLVPGLANFYGLVTPIKLLSNELSVLNKLYEDNHTVNKLLIADLQQTDNLLTGLGKTAIDARINGVLYAESMKSLTAILNTGQSRIVGTAEEMTALTNSVAANARATGIEDAALAKLTLRMKGLTGSVQEGNQLMDAMVIGMRDSGMSTAQMNKVVGVLNKDLIRLNKAYTVYDKQGDKVVSGSKAIINVMSGIAKAAAKAGADVDVVMDLMTRAIESPLDMAALLGPALSSRDFGQQMLILGERSEMFADQMSRLPPMLQKTFAASLGASPDQINEMAKASAQQRQEVEKLAETMGMEAARKEYALRLAKDKAAADEAEAIRQQALDTATRQMAEAWDQVRIVFGKVAVAFQPILDAIAWVLNVPFVPQILAWTSLLLGFVLVLKKLGITLPWIGKIFRKTGDDVGKAAKQGSGKGFVQFGKSLRQFINELGKIKMQRALKAAGTIALVGVALGVGVAAIGLAARLLPPDKMIQLTATLAGIVGAMYILANMQDIGQKALPGAGMLIAVGAALAIGVGAIGAAAHLLPPDRAMQLALTLGAILGSMVILAVMGNIGWTSLIGAVLLLAVGAALAGSLAMIGLAAKLMSPEDILGLLAVTTILLVTMGILALLGPIGFTALIGALVLLAVGAALAGAIAMIGLAMQLVPADGMDRALGLLSMVGAMALMAVVAPLALVGAVILLAAAVPLTLALLMLGGVSGMAIKAGQGIMIITKSLKGLTPAMGRAIADLGTGLLDFALALASGAIMEFLGGDMVGTATRMGEALKTLADPVKTMANIPDAGKTLSRLGQGLNDLSAGLDQDSFFGLIKKDFVGVATRLAGALKKLAEPVKMMAGGANLTDIGIGLGYIAEALSDARFADMFGADEGSGLIQTAGNLGKALELLTEPIKGMTDLGPEAAKSFVELSKGLDIMEDQLSKGGVFEFFTGDKVENAKQLAKAMSEVAGPMAEIQKAGGQAFAQGMAEELRSGLAVDIQRTEAEGDDPVVNKLEEIRMAIVESSDKEMLERLSSVLEKLNRVPASGKFGGMSSADSSYV